MRRLLVSVVVLVAALSPIAPARGAADHVSWWRPNRAMSWQIQLSGAVDTSYDVDIYDVDLFDTPQATVDELHARGVAVTCYFSAGSWEEWREDAGTFRSSVVGRPLDGWPGESWLDVRRLSVRGVMAARLDLAAAKGCDAVDPDNVDGYQNDTGFPISYEHQRRYNRWLASQAHLRGMGVGLKNDLGQVPDLVGIFDFQVNEECFDYDECGALSPFIDRRKPVLQLTYGDPDDLAATICPAGDALGFNVLIKDLDLGPRRFSCREDAG